MCGRLCTHTDTHPNTPPTHTRTAAWGPQNNQTRTVFSPGEAAENAPVVIRAARVSANFCPFIFRVWQKGGSKLVKVVPESSASGGFGVDARLPPGETPVPPPYPLLSLFWLVRLSSPAFPGKRAKRREGQGLRRGSSAPAVHGRRGCPPPRLAPGPEGRESGQRAAGGRVPAAAKELTRQRLHGTGLRVAEAAPGSLQQTSTRSCTPQTD